MKRIAHILISAAAAILTGTALPSCIYDDGYDTHELPDNIHINTGTLDNAIAIAADPYNTFRLLFWMEGEKNTDHLATPSGDPWKTLPYLSVGAPQAVPFYTSSVFDTGYPYPYPDNSLLYATGFAPDGILSPAENTDGNPPSADDINNKNFSYHKLKAAKTDGSELSGAELSHIDFLTCDYWPEVYRGSKVDPFAQPKNKLYFRHLAAKLVFIAIRDPQMENRQHVRNIKIKNLQMSTDGASWGDMWAPCTFEWQALRPDDFSATYNSIIGKITAIPGNGQARDTKPLAGYKATAAKPFAGKPGDGTTGDYVLERGDNDRVPIDGQKIDSCYVCNPFPENTPTPAAPGGNIRLKMDIYAELSYDPNYSKPDYPTEETKPDGSTTTIPGSTTDNLTFDKEWLGQVTEIKEVIIGADGKPQVSDNKVAEFKAGREYRIYVKFYRTGVSIVAREMPWNYGGIHYITFQGGDQTSSSETSGN